MKLRGVAFVALAASLGFVGCEADRAKVASTTGAIVNGDVDLSDTAVVMIAHRRVHCGEAAAVTCSGVLIADRVVLTAAHCVEGAGEYEVGFGARADDPSAKWDVALSTSIHPQYDPTTHAYDVALVQLAETAPAAPSALRSAPLDASLVGMSVRVVGFGVDGDAGSTPGVKRAGTMNLSAVDAASFDATPGPSMSCTGDSGGPVFLGEEVAGITAYGDPACATSATNVRVDVLVDFISPFVAKVQAITPGEPSGAIAPSAICATPCSASADCPSGLACIAIDGVGRCTVPGSVPAGFSSECTDDAACAGGFCAQVWSSRCACATACSDAPTIPPSTSTSGSTSSTGGAGGGSSGGCAFGASRANPAWIGAIAIAFALTRVRRSRRRS